MNHRKLIAALAALGLVVAGVGAVTATAPALDTETTDTATTTELDGTSTQSYSETTSSFMNYSQDTNNTEVTLYQGSATNGRELVTYGESSDQVNYDTTASSTYYWNLEVDDDASDYTGLEADAGESVTVTAQLTDLGDASTTYNNVSYTFANGANTSFINYNDSETETAEASRLARLSTISLDNITGQSDVAGAAQVEQDIGVNGENQDQIVVNIENADAQASAEEMFENSEEKDGVTYLGHATVDGEFVPILAEDADAPNWIDTSDDAYMVVSQDGQTVTVENAGDVIDQGDTTATVEITANEQMDRGQTVDMWENYDRDTNVLSGLSLIDINGNPDFEPVEA